MKAVCLLSFLWSKRMKKSIYILVPVLLITVILLSGHQLWRHYTDEKETGEQYNTLAGQIELPPQMPDEPPSALPGQPDETLPEWTVFDQYGALFGQNPDMIGWIAIDGTVINYPVMQTPDRPDFYLKHDFERQPNNSGVPYAAASCTINPQSDNITIFGHHMKGGAMFAALENYKNEAFYSQHPIIRFDTRAGFGQYVIFAVFKVSPADFRYNMFVNAADEAEFDGYVRRCLELSFYDTGITAEYGDKLITLSTCEYSVQGNRLVVVAKKIQQGGLPDEQNQNP